MHVCFISQEYPPETGWGGIGSYTHDMAHALVDAGHHVTVIARAEGCEHIADDRGVAVHRVQPAPHWERMRVLWRLGRFWPGFAWAAMRHLRDLHRSAPVDVVESAENRADGFFLSWLPEPRPRIVTRLHLAWVFVDRNNAIQPDFRRRVTYWLEKRSILCADAVTAPSLAVVGLTREWLGRRLDARIVPNPIDVGSFSPGGDARAREILFVGRLEAGKGVEIFSRALPQVLERCPGVRVRIVGADGTDAHGRSWRARICSDLSEAQRGRVIFEHLSRTDLMERYHSTAVCVVPSVWENCPYTVLEAMASGTPVVATRTGGLPELIEDGHNGVLAPPDDAAALSEALCGLLENPERARRLGRAARRCVEDRFSSAAIAAQMLLVYRQLCKN
jgi:glycogen(starch) synthase